MARAARQPERNPVEKRAEWLAKNYPRTVVADTLAAWAEAVGVDAYVERFRQAALYEPVETSLRVIDVILTLRPDLRATYYDTYLPWVAKTLNEKHKELLRVHRARAADGKDERLWLIAASRDYGELLYNRSRVGGPPLDMIAIDGYTLLRDALIPRFGLIGRWAHQDGVDLGRLSFEEAWEGAYAWINVGQPESAKDPHGVIVYTWPDGWTVRELKTKADLVHEGNTMGHCVKSYEPGDARQRLFSLRDPKNVPHATLEWWPEYGHVNQLRGRGNVLPMPKHTARMAEFRDQYFPTVTLTKVAVPTVDEVRSGSKLFEGRYLLSKIAGGDEDSIEVWNGAFYHPLDVDADIEDYVSMLDHSGYAGRRREKMISTYFPASLAGIHLPALNEWFFARRGHGMALLDNDDELVQAVVRAVDDAQDKPIFAALRKPTGKRV